MSIWDLRQMIESSIPWWIPFVISVFMLTICILVSPRRKK